MSERPMSEILASLASGDLATVEKALAEIGRLKAASAREDEAFRRWFQEGAHGNVVRAAERAHDKAQYPAIDAAREACRRFPELDVHYGFDVTFDDFVAALTAKRNELVERITSLETE